MLPLLTELGFIGCWNYKYIAPMALDLIARNTSRQPSAGFAQLGHTIQFPN
jgi:hypothetical protein